MTTQSRLLWLLFAVNLAVAAAGVALWRHVIWRERLAAVDQILRDKVVIFTRSILSDQPLFWPDVDVELETRTFPLVRLVYQPDGLQVRQLPATGETLFLREATRKAAIETRAHVMETIDGGRLGPLRVATYPKWRWGTPEQGPLVEFLGQLLLPLPVRRRRPQALVLRQP